MSLRKMISGGEDQTVVKVLLDHEGIEFHGSPDLITLDPVIAVNLKSAPPRSAHLRPRLPGRIAIIGNYLPRQCGIATFTTDLCDTIHAEFGTTELLALPVNDTPEGYSYPARVRFELSQDELASYRQAADFLNFSNIDLVCVRFCLNDLARIP